MVTGPCMALLEWRIKCMWCDIRVTVIHEDGEIPDNVQGISGHHFPISAAPDSHSE